MDVRTMAAHFVSKPGNRMTFFFQFSANQLAHIYVCFHKSPVCNKKRGLMSYRSHYRQRQSGYYSFDNLIIIIAFIYLCRIKSFERIKHYSPGEFGKLVGYDRIPEVKTLRGMVGEITAQKRADLWLPRLAKVGLLKMLLSCIILTVTYKSITVTLPI